MSTNFLKEFFRWLWASLFSHPKMLVEGTGETIPIFNVESSPNSVSMESVKVFSGSEKKVPKERRRRKSSSSRHKKEVRKFQDQSRRRNRPKWGQPKTRRKITKTA
jgi:hypothetical protein